MKLSREERQEMRREAKNLKNRRAFRAARNSVMKPSYDHYIAALDDLEAFGLPHRQQRFVVYRFLPL